MFLVKFGLFVKMICCLFDQFFVRYIDGKYRSANAPPNYSLLRNQKHQLR